MVGDNDLNTLHRGGRARATGMAHKVGIGIRTMIVQTTERERDREGTGKGKEKCLNL